MLDRAGVFETVDIAEVVKPEYKEILEGYRDRVVHMLGDLISFKSVKAEPVEGMPFGEEVHKAYRYMLEKAGRDGFETFDADGWGGHIDWLGALTDERGEIVAAADETLGIAVHLDVVPAGDGWTKDPWGGEVTGGHSGGEDANGSLKGDIVESRIYGRGTTDNKNAVSAVYYAMLALKESGFVPSKNIRLILGLDEESGWSGIDKYYEQTEPPDFGFAPDAFFPVINGEKGFIIFDIAKKLETGHENGLFLRSVTGGTAPNVVPDQCRAILVFESPPLLSSKSSRGAAKGGKTKSSIGAAKTKQAFSSGVATKTASGSQKAATADTRARESAFEFVKAAVVGYRERTGARITCKGSGSSLEVVATGVSAHGAQPEKGVNAISVLMDFLSGLPLANESARDFVKFYMTHIGYETDGKSLGIAMEDKLSGSLVVNAGMIDLSREAAVLTVNIRYPVSKDEEDVYRILRPMLDENGLGLVKDAKSIKPLYFNPDEPFIKTLMDVYRENTGDTESQPVVIGGGTYARAMPKAVAFGPNFPGEEEMAHQKDEFVRLDSLMKSAQIYADAIYCLTK